MFIVFPQADMRRYQEIVFIYAKYDFVTKTSKILDASGPELYNNLWQKYSLICKNRDSKRIIIR